MSHFFNWIAETCLCFDFMFLQRYSVFDYYTVLGSSLAVIKYSWKKLLTGSGFYHWFDWHFKWALILQRQIILDHIHTWLCLCIKKFKPVYSEMAISRKFLFLILLQFSLLTKWWHQWQVLLTCDVTITAVNQVPCCQTGSKPRPQT